MSGTTALFAYWRRHDYEI